MTARSSDTQSNHRRRGRPLGRVQPIVPGEKLCSFSTSLSGGTVGTSTKEFTCRKANQAVTLVSQSTVKLKGDTVNVDPLYAISGTGIPGQPGRLSTGCVHRLAGQE